MKRYSALIRKLIEATAEAESQGKDVADLLRRRCFNDTSIIRQTLMNAVCDPRFKIYSNTVGFWREEARASLEELARQLDSQEGLTAEDADNMLEAFLSAWFKMTFNKIVIPQVQQSNYFDPPKKDPEKTLEDGLEMLEDIEKEFEPARKQGTPTARSRKTGNNTGRRAVVPGTEEGETHPEEEMKMEPEKQEEQQQSHSGTTSWSNTKNKKRIEQLEDRFLSNIPQSLVELARRIGRMGENGMQKEGRFLTAAKSDISGITVGNDLSAVLPSELAMLAEPKTQSIFLSNYSARRLQLFASASQVKTPDKHQDGPVIICVDTSGSMNGEPVRVAKALTVAVSIIAWRRKRNVFVITYADRYDYLNLGCNRSRLGELSGFLSVDASGGNNENQMFQWLFKDVVNNLSDYDSADVLCVSDFGWAELNGTTSGLIEKQKKHGMRLYGLNVTPRFLDYEEFAGNFCNDYPSAMDICDSVWCYSDGECTEVKKNDIQTKKP